MANVRVIHKGAAKTGNVWPYTLCFVANPWIEAPEKSGNFVLDPIVMDETLFDDRVAHAIDAIFGRLPDQAEAMFAPLADDIRIISIFANDLPRKDSNALVAHDNTNILIPRQPKFVRFLRAFEVEGMGKVRADVAFALSASATHDRSAAYYTLDDDGANGRDFMLDDQEMCHRQTNTMPGTVALHITARSIVALHEFGHAGSSWTNGMVTDLYVDDGDGINKRRGLPIEPHFCTYDGSAYASAHVRWNDVPYPDDWTSYHAELADPRFPAVMDNFWIAAGGRSEMCRHDTLTRQFLLDRITTIMSR